MDDDRALKSSDNAVGRRGLCGTLIIHKIAGALASQGASLEDILAHLHKVKPNLGTIGLSLSPCSLPGRGPSFSLGPDEMELGLGIHGEAGVKRIPLASAKTVVATMMHHMNHCDADEATPRKDRVVVMVNNLGGTSYLELNIVAKEVVDYLHSKSIQVDKVLSGTFMTALEMAGVSITMLLLEKDDVNLKLLEAPTAAPAWPNVLPAMRGMTSFQGYLVAVFVCKSYLSFTSFLYYHVLKVSKT